VYILLSTLPNDSRNILDQTNSKTGNRNPATSQTQHPPKKTNQHEQLPFQWTKCIEQLTTWFTDFDFNALGVETGFTSRTPRKVTGLLFLQSSILLVCQKSLSLRRWAVLLGLLSHGTLAKQSLWGRINEGAINFIQRVLAMALITKSTQDNHAPEVLKHFKRVLVQDSTNIKLSKKLASTFPGSSNLHGNTGGMLKIQAIQDLVSQRFLYFALSGFTRNDQAAAYDILKAMKKGDLILRDLGYMVLDSLEKIAQSGAYYLSRLPSRVLTWDPSTKQKYDLLKQLQLQGNLDREMLIGEAKIRVRLVAIKLPPEVAAERRRKAKTNRDKRLNPDTRSLALLDWAIFVTNVPNDICDAQEVMKIYRLRWRIETIFKAWKSHFRLCDIPMGSAEQVRVIICARLLFITVLANLSGCHWFASRKEHENQVSSMLKVAATLGDFFLPLCFEVWEIRIMDALSMQLEYHCNYDKRSRLNYVQKLLDLT